MLPSRHAFFRIAARVDEDTQQQPAEAEAEAAALFGLSRPTFYQAQTVFAKDQSALYALAREGA